MTIRMPAWAGLLLPAALCIGPSWADVGSPQVSSPDGRITLTAVVDRHGAPGYRITRDGETLLSESRLGLRFQQSAHFDEGFQIVARFADSSDTVWEQPWGERREVRDRHMEMAVIFAADSPARRFLVRFRVFDDGVGFRYEVPEQDGYGQVNIVDELTEFHVPGVETAWWIPGFGWNRYEFLYQSTDLSAVQFAATPMTVKLGSGIHLSFHEAALVDYAGYVIDQRRPNRLKTNLTPWSDGVRVRTRVPFETPWRTIQIADDAVGLANSSLILNLNEPNALGDVSWVEPGKYVGIWWAMHIDHKTWGSGARHGATTEAAKRYIDFAARHGFDGVLVEGWNLGWDGDWFNNGDVFSFTQPYPDFDIRAVTDYGRDRGVRLIGHHETSGSVTNYERQMAAAYDLYQSLGVRQVKTGYVADGGNIKRVDAHGVPHYEWHDGQFAVGEYLKSVTEAAKRQISINTHEPVKDTGLRRTYPNWLTREGARGQEFNAWGQPSNPPEHTVLLPFTRMLAGPMDFTPGIFDLMPRGKDDPRRVQTTLAKQLALYVVLYSPIHMAADLPENYQQRLDAFQFIKDVPTDWEASIALTGAVGDYVAFARQRRGGEDWYVGAITDEEARQLDLALDFLPEGQRFKARLYRDGADADWRTNPYDIVIEERTLTRSDRLLLSLGPGGGAAIQLVPVTPDLP